jgi:hypothetical protein
MQRAKRLKDVGWSAIVAKLSFFVAVALCVLVGFSLLASWPLIDIQPDTPVYLAPAATAVYEGGWTHYLRPFLYPFFIFLAVDSGGSIDVLVAVQLVAYVLSALLLYAVVIAPARAVVADRRQRFFLGADAASHLLAVLAVVAYFAASTRYLASAYFVGPELLSSFAALLALWASLLLMLYGPMPARHLLGALLLAGLSAGMLVGLKPALLLVAAVPLACAAWRLGRNVDNLGVMHRLAAFSLVLAMPAFVLMVDAYLVERYNDRAAAFFGPATAFCNNADIVKPLLEVPDSRVRQVVSAAAAADLTDFLAEVLADDSWSLMGYNGDQCMYTLAQHRVRIEREHFGPDLDAAADMYAQIVVAAAWEAPTLFAARVARQLHAFAFIKLPLDCAPHYQQNWPRGSFSHRPLVQRLVEEKSTGSAGRQFPEPPPVAWMCRSTAEKLEFLWPFALVSAGLGILLLLRRSVRAGRRLSLFAVAALLGGCVWISSAAIVALVHSFDINRYATVIFPVYIATLALCLRFAVAILLTLVSIALVLLARLWKVLAKRPPAVDLSQ